MGVTVGLPAEWPQSQPKQEVITGPQAAVIVVVVVVKKEVVVMVMVIYMPC